MMLKSLAIALAAFAAGSMPLQSGTDPEFSIDWYTIDGGGGTSAGGPFSLTGTIGQHDAHPSAAQGGEFALVGGFWTGGQAAVEELIFRDGFEDE
jgi:hypothetical protein